ncbi:MAG: hypothetical protein K0R03_2617 [Moraxellaceae bacterium]|jgi:uncharacterized RDD family membrane protein YckC|nr:hypothetical protein [Moraxellaceae bacterium]
MEGQHYAGFWIRTAATLIDCVVLGVIIYLPLTLIYGPEYWVSDEFIQGFWDAVLSHLLPAVLVIWFWRKHRGTPGKMLLKLRVVDAETGDTLTLPQAIGRYLAYIPAALVLFLGFIWVGFSGRKQGWHDMMAGTVVVRE